MAQLQEPLVARYLSGQMSSQEMDEFEKRLAAEPALWDEIRASRAFHNAASRAVDALTQMEIGAVGAGLASNIDGANYNGSSSGRISRMHAGFNFSLPKIEDSPIRRSNLLASLKGTEADGTTTRSVGASFALHVLGLFALTFITFGSTGGKISRATVRAPIQIKFVPAETRPQDLSKTQTVLKPVKTAPAPTFAQPQKRTLAPQTRPVQRPKPVQKVQPKPIVQRKPVQPTPVVKTVPPKPAPVKPTTPPVRPTTTTPQSPVLTAMAPATASPTKTFTVPETPATTVQTPRAVNTALSTPTENTSAQPLNTSVTHAAATPSNVAPAATAPSSAQGGASAPSAPTANAQAAAAASGSPQAAIAPAAASGSPQAAPSAHASALPSGATSAPGAPESLAGGAAKTAKSAGASDLSPAPTTSSAPAAGGQAAGAAGAPAASAMAMAAPGSESAPAFSAGLPAAGSGPGAAQPKRSAIAAATSGGGAPGPAGMEVGGAKAAASTASGKMTGQGIPHTLIGSPGGLGRPQQGSGLGPRPTMVAMSTGSSVNSPGSLGLVAPGHSTFNGPRARHSGMMPEAGGDSGVSGGVSFPGQKGSAQQLPTQGGNTGMAKITGDKTNTSTYGRRTNGGSGQIVAIAPRTGEGEGGGFGTVFVGGEKSGAGNGSSPAGGHVPYGAFGITLGADQAAGPGGVSSPGFYGKGSGERASHNGSGGLAVGPARTKNQVYGGPRGGRGSAPALVAGVARGSGEGGAVFSGGVVDGARGGVMHHGPSHRAGSAGLGGRGQGGALTIAMGPTGRGSAASGSGRSTFAPAVGAGMTGQAYGRGSGRSASARATGMAEASGEGGSAFGVGPVFGGSGGGHATGPNSRKPGIGLGGGVAGSGVAVAVNPMGRGSAASGSGGPTFAPAVNTGGGGHSYGGGVGNSNAPMAGAVAYAGNGGGGTGTALAVPSGTFHGPGQPGRGRVTRGLSGGNGAGPGAVAIAMAGRGTAVGSGGGGLSTFAPALAGGGSGSHAGNHGGLGNVSSGPGSMDVAAGGGSGSGLPGSDTGVESGGGYSGNGSAPQGHGSTNVDVADVGAGGKGPSGFDSDPGLLRRTNLNASAYDLTGNYEMPGAVTTGDYNWHINDMAKLLGEISNRTEVRVRLNQQYVDPSKQKIRNAPLIVFTGHKAFTLTDAQRAALKQYVEDGGTIWGDYSHSEFDNSFRSEMIRIFGQPVQLTTEHPIFHSKYEIDRVPPGDLGETKPLEGIYLQGSRRLAVIITPNRYFGSLDGPPHVTEAQYEQAVKLGVNIYLYAVKGYQAVHPSDQTVGVIDNNQ